MNILEEFWCGNLEPAEYDTSPCKDYKETLQLAYTALFDTMQRSSPSVAFYFVILPRKSRAETTSSLISALFKLSRWVHRMIILATSASMISLPSP